MKSLLVLLLFFVSFCVAEDVFSGGMRPYLVKKEHRKSLIVTEYGEVSAIDIPTGSSRGDHYHLEFITLEPNSLFLPVLLHANMVFYVHTGSGKLSWAEDGKDMKRMHIKKGDVYRLHPGSVFFMQSNLEAERQKLRVYAIFANTDEDIYDQSIGAYSSINDLVLGFDKKLLQSAFKVSDEVIEEMTSAMKPPAIVHAVPEKKSMFWEIEARLLNAFTSNKDDIFYGINNGGKKKTKTFNILDADPDFKNCNGWSVTVGRKDLKSLRGSNMGVFMVNLTKGSMMGPHWNPLANEIAIVLEGQGMVRVVCSSNINETECKNMRFRAKQGDLFSVPRFHPMAQMSFNNESLVFMGFSTSTRKNYPQFLVGKKSVLQTLNKEILALSFNVTNDTVDELLTPQDEAIILDCTSCAEEEETKMKEEKEREKQEEEAREREEERKREEEAAKKREEEEEREREEEEAREREEERKREEEAAKKKEEEEREREREKKREQEEKKRKEEEEREEEEEEERERREREREAAEKRQRKEWRRQEEAARREQEQARKEEEERQKRQRQEEKEARKKREREEEPEEEQTKKAEQEREGEGAKGRRAPRKIWKV